VPALLGEAALAAGQAIALGARDECRRGYWLVAPPPQWRQKKVKALVAHLTAP
jgi:LysR family glycine cleavage system transcriptional activator